MTASGQSSSWVAALSAGQHENWEICKERSLWGSGANSAGSVREGDDLFVWQSGGGWFARCSVTSDARRPTVTDPAPWHDGRDYKWLFGIRVVKELDPTYNPGSTEDRQNITDIPNIRLGQFPRLSTDESMAVRSFFGLVNPPDDSFLVVIEREDDEHEREILQRNFDGPIDKEQLVMARRGQGVFRSNVEQIETSCRITGLRVLRHLRASHIKPWRDSDDSEKVDGYNGLMLSPHVDHLFDRGWIRFEDDGTFVPSQKLEEAVLKSWRIEQPRDPVPFVPRQIDYLIYHREFMFQK